MIYSTLHRWMPSSIGISVVFFATVLARGQIILAHPVSATQPATEPPAIVIGFVGGFIAHDNPIHSEVQLAARLRKEYPTGADVETWYDRIFVKPHTQIECDPIVWDQVESLIQANLLPVEPIGSAQ